MANNGLISRAELLAAYDRVHVGPPGEARKLIEDAPAVDAVPVVRCVSCKYSRMRNKHEREYLHNDVLICTNTEVYEDGWGPVWFEHFCKCGVLPPMIKTSEVLDPPLEESDEVCEACRITYSHERDGDSK